MAHSHDVALRPDDLRISKTSLWGKLAPICGAIGVVGLIAAGVLYGKTTAKEFYFSYLTAFLYWLSLALGGLFFVIVQYATRAGWSIAVRRIAENTMATMPLMALLAIPLLFGTHDLFHWTHPEVAEHDPFIKGKVGYLNLPFFYTRAVIYFAIWLGLSHFFYRRSVKQDAGTDEKATRQMVWLAPLGILLYALSQTFASFDWIMSLDPHWFSTMYGVYYFAGSVVAIMAFLSLIAVGLHMSGQLRDVITIEHHHDLGKLLFGFVVFWAYIAFSQYMLYWYANIPEETAWFRHRFVGNWQVLSVVLAVGHFGVPFFFLMSRHIKRRPLALLAGAVWMLVLHYLDLYWQVMPTVHHHGAHFTLLDAALFLGMGGLFLAVFFWLLRRHPAVPAGDPRLAESVAHENF